MGSFPILNTKICSQLLFQSYIPGLMGAAQHNYTYTTATGGYTENPLDLIFMLAE